MSIKINLDETKVRKEYFYYLFLQSNLRYLDSGSAQSQITINDLANVEISAPSLNVQDLIVKSLKAFDDKITTLSSMNQTLEQMSQTLFKSWFVDFDPVIDNALDAGNPIPEALQTRAKLRQKVRNSADFKRFRRKFARFSQVNLKKRSWVGCQRGGKKGRFQR